MAEVKIRDLRKSFGTVEILHGVSIDIEEGEFVVLVGPSGCGKSTLLRMLAGLEHVTSGEIAIGERVVNDLPPKERDIAMVFQNYALYPHLTVADNMAFSLTLKNALQGRDRRRGCSPAAEILGLTHLLERYPAPALRRPAPARGDGPGDRARPAGLPVRRAALEPRRQAARLDAGGDQEPAPAAEDDDGLRHPRPDRGDDHGRQDRRHARRPGRADRRAARALRQAGQPLRRGLHRLAGDEHADRPDRRDEAAASSPATASRCRSAGRLGGSRRAAVVYGLRPESMQLGGDVPLRVDVVEPTGSETHVLGRLGATEVVGVFRERIAARPGRGDPRRRSTPPPPTSSTRPPGARISA